MHDYWLKQTPDAPLFPNLLWSRPENRQLAGKLLVIGGNAQGFAAPAEAFAAAEQAGIGTARVMLPDALQKTISKVFAAAEFAPSTPSGSFAQTSLAELLSAAMWADGILLAGDFGRNSETAILLETFTTKYSGHLTLVGDALDYFINLPAILDRTQTLLVPTFSQLQKLATAARTSKPFTSSLDLLHFVEALHELETAHNAHLITEHDRTIAVASNNRLSSTTFSIYTKPSSLHLATHATVWWLQNSNKPFEALTTGIL